MAANWNLSLSDNWSPAADKIIAKAAAVKRAISGIAGASSRQSRAAEKSASAAERAAEREYQAWAKSQERIVAAEEKAAARREAIAERLAQRKEAILKKSEAREAKKQSKEHEETQKKLIGASKQLLTGGGTGGFMSMAEAAGPEAAAAAAALEVMSEVVEKGYDLVKEGANMVIEATTFHDMTVGAFQNMLGSAREGEEMFEKGIALSEKLGSTQPAMMEKLKLFMASGMKPEEVEKAVTTVENATVGINSRAGMAVQRSLITTATKGFLDNRGLTALRMAGVNVQDIYKGVAEAMHKPQKEVELLIRKGKVSADIAMGVIESVVNAKSGGMAEKRGQSVPGLLAALKIEIYDKLFADTTGTVLNPVTNFLSKGLDALHGPAGEHLHNSIMGFFGKLFHGLFGAFEGPDGGAKLSNMIDTIANGIDALTPVVEVLGEAFTYTVRAFSYLLERYNEPAGERGVLYYVLHYARYCIDPLYRVYMLITAIAEAWQWAFGRDTGETSGTKAGDATSKALQASSTVIKLPAKGAAAEGKPEMVDAGAEMADGLVAGLERGQGAAHSAGRRLAASAAAGARDEAQIHSPSRVFHGYGVNVSRSFASGIENDNSGARAARMMVAPPSAGISGGGGGASRGGNTSVLLDFKGSEFHSDATDPKAAANDFMRQAESYWEDLVTELGG